MINSIPGEMPSDRFIPVDGTSERIDYFNRKMDATASPVIVDDMQPAVDRFKVLEDEYLLIQQKKSKLSAGQRRLVVQIYEKIKSDTSFAGKSIVGFLTKTA